MKKIAILYTTFIRPELAHQTLFSIYQNWQDNFFLLVADQGEPEDRKLIFPFSEEFATFMEKLKYFHLPFDCGLSFARNFLVEKALEMKIDYCLITADSIQFTPQTIEKLQAAISYLRSDKALGILGFELNGRIPWEFFMDIKDGHFFLKKPGDLKTDEKTGLRVKECDICRNFFLAKTKILSKIRWDDELKLCEHEDFFWRFKQAGYKAAWTPNISAEYINSKTPQYEGFRNRIYTEYMQLLQKKYHLSGWVIYDKDQT